MKENRVETTKHKLPREKTDSEISTSNINRIRNVTKDKKIGAYNDVPWFDDALRYVIHDICCMLLYAKTCLYTFALGVKNVLK